MPHIVGEDDLQTCIVELLAISETLHTNMESYTGPRLHRAQEFEAKLQEFTTKTLAKVEELTKIEQAILAE